MVRGRKSLRDSVDASQPPSPSGSEEDEESGARSPNGLGAKTPVRGRKSRASLEKSATVESDEMDVEPDESKISSRS